MKKSMNEFNGLGGIRLCMQSWEPDDKECRAAVIMMHGGNNYCDMSTYNMLAEGLVNRGFSVYSYDARSFGRSAGHPAMHMASWNDFRGDMTAFLHLVKSYHPDKPIFAYGISFGAVQVMDQAIVSPHLLDGVIANSFSTIPLKMSPIMQGMIKLVGKVFPKISIKSQMQPSYKGALLKVNDPELAQDSLCPRTMTLGFTCGLLKRQKNIANELEYIQMPVLHQQGLDDDITRPDSSIAKKIGSSDYTYKTYPDTGHELLEGKDPQKVLNDIVKWLEARS